MAFMQSRESDELKSHFKIILTLKEISIKIAGFVNSKLKSKDFAKLCPDVHRKFTITSI